MKNWAERFVCPREDEHGCVACEACGTEQHNFREEPYCDDCGLPHPGYFGRIKSVIGYPLSDREKAAVADDEDTVIS